uniref:Uncharacterized protein n=1 Tax=Ralstonia solanacearum CFBP2957 TaxID=859656 RepID=D8P4C7_RALSL|nr:protein of unknown function [Ralstonia solanacearum CFBP2957]
MFLTPIPGRPVMQRAPVQWAIPLTAFSAGCRVRRCAGDWPPDWTTGDIRSPPKISI